MSNSKRFFLEDGSYIRFKKSGSGRPLVLLHTIRNRLEYFDQITPFLTKFFTVYAIDLPGFGGSPVHKDVNYDQQYMAKAVADFVSKKKLSKLTLVGEPVFLIAFYFIFCEEFLGIAIIPPSFLIISPEKLFFDKNSSIKSKINISSPVTESIFINF